MKFGFLFKIFFFLLCLSLYLSGLLYFAFDLFVRVETQFGPNKHFLQKPILHLHAILGLIFLVVFGFLIEKHIVPGLKGVSRYKSGLALFMFITFLCFSVPFLYYSPNENLQFISAQVHTYIGIVSILFFMLHIYLYEKSKKRKL